MHDVISDDHVYLRSQDLALILRMTECARITSAYTEPSDFRNNEEQTCRLQSCFHQTLLSLRHFD